LARIYTNTTNTIYKIIVTTQDTKKALVYSGEGKREHILVVEGNETESSSKFDSKNH
jgi:hypothetical protein